MSVRTRTLSFALYGAFIAVWSGGTLRTLYEVSRGDESSSHLVLVPLISLILIYQGRRRIFTSVTFAWRDGLSTLVAGLALTLVAGSGSRGGGPETSFTLSLVGLLGMVVGGYLLFFGAKALHAARFPLWFLAFTIPIPGLLLSGATEILKTGSTEVVAGLFTLTGTPYHREGFAFTLPAFTIEVADECSGIRSFIALMLTALLLGHRSLNSLSSKVLLVLAVFPIAILKNALRIVSLSLLAAYVDPGFMAGSLHSQGGVVFFLIALVALVPALFLLRRLEGPGCSVVRHAPVSLSN